MTIITTATKEECLACLLKHYPELEIKEISDLKTGYSYTNPECTELYAQYNYINVIGYDKNDTYHNCNMMYSATGTHAIALKKAETLN